MLLASVILVISAFSCTWASAILPLVAGTQMPVHQVDVIGREVYPMASGLAWVALASVIALIAARSWARIAIGVILVVIGAVIFWGCINFGLHPQVVLADVLPADLPTANVVAVTFWWLIGLLGGLGLMLAGVLTVLFGRGWPGLGRRFDRQGGQPPVVTSIGIWDALDRGEDPTT